MGLKKGRFALTFRLIAVVFTIVTLAYQFGVFHGTFSLGVFTYYTIQSNILALVMFTALAVRTEKGVWENRDSSNGAYFTRFRMVCAVNLLITFVVFWAFLAPNLPVFYLLSFDNLSVHVIVPLLCLADYIIFSEVGRLKYRDVYFTLIFPLTYVAFAAAAGFSGYEYGVRFITTETVADELVKGYTEPERFPYFFLDFDVIGLWVIAYIAGIAAFFVLLAHGFYLLDRRALRKRSESQIAPYEFESVTVAPSRPVFTAVFTVIAFMMCAAVGAGKHHVPFGKYGVTEEYGETSGGVVLRTGRYIHESGDRNKYITVYDYDYGGTIQVFGFDYYEYVTDNPERLQEYMDSALLGMPRRETAGLLRTSEWLKQKSKYLDEIDENGMFSVKIITDDNEDNYWLAPIFRYIDDSSVGFYDGVYVLEVVMEDRDNN